MPSALEGDNRDDDGSGDSDESQDYPGDEEIWAIRDLQAIGLRKVSALQAI